MLYLHGIGHFHPENVITNRFLEELEIGTDEAWIMERVGIRERRTVLPLDYIRETKNREPRMAHEVSIYRNAQMAAAAARTALERAGLTPGDIGLVISGSSIPSHTTPAEAATVAAELGIDAPCFDVNSACTTFGMQVDLLNRMAADKLPPFVLITQPEGITRAIDFSDRSSAVLFGDACTAAVLSTTVKARVAVVESNCGTTHAAALGEGVDSLRLPFPPGRPCRPGVRHPPDDRVPPGPQSGPGGCGAFPVHRPPGEPGGAPDRLRAGGDRGRAALAQRVRLREHGERRGVLRC